MNRFIELRNCWYLPHVIADYSTNHILTMVRCSSCCGFRCTVLICGDLYADLGWGQLWKESGWPLYLEGVEGEQRESGAGARPAPLTPERSGLGELELMAMLELPGVVELRGATGRSTDTACALDDGRLPGAGP